MRFGSMSPSSLLGT